MPAQISKIILRLVAYILAKLRTSAARVDAVLGANTRLTSTGKIINIAGQKNKVRVGANCAVSGELLVFAHAGSITVGDWTFVGQGSHIWSSSKIEIGNRVLISHAVEIHDTESHPLNADKRFEQTKLVLTTGHPTKAPDIRAAPIKIGDDVWIGFGATIRKGVTIGDRAIISARSIVSSDVSPDTIHRRTGD